MRISTISRARQNLRMFFKKVSPSQVHCSYLHLQILGGDKWDTDLVSLAYNFQNPSFLVFSHLQFALQYIKYFTQFGKTFSF